MKTKQEDKEVSMHVEVNEYKHDEEKIPVEVNEIKMNQM